MKRTIPYLCEFIYLMRRYMFVFLLLIPMGALTIHDLYSSFVSCPPEPTTDIYTSRHHFSVPSSFVRFTAQSSLDPIAAQLELTLPNFQPSRLPTEGDTLIWSRDILRVTVGYTPKSGSRMPPLLKEAPENRGKVSPRKLKYIGTSLHDDVYITHDRRMYVICPGADLRLPSPQCRSNFVVLDDVGASIYFPYSYLEHFPRIAIWIESFLKSHENKT